MWINKISKNLCSTVFKTSNSYAFASKNTKDKQKIEKPVQKVSLI